MTILKLGLRYEDSPHLLPHQLNIGCANTNKVRLLQSQPNLTNSAVQAVTVSDNAASVEFVVGEEEPVEVSVVSRERGGEELLVNFEFVQTSFAGTLDVRFTSCRIS